MKQFIIKSLAAIAAACAATTVANAAEQADTLMTAATAQRITIESTQSKTTLVVTRINHSPENYYYQTTADTTDTDNAGATSTITYDNISAISVVETDGQLQLNFSNADNQPVTLAYNINDPENRSVTSWTGTRGSDFGINIGKKGSTRFEIVLSGIAYGWVAATKPPKQMNPSMWHSHEYSWLNLLALRISRGRHAFKAGLGIRFRDIQTKGGEYFHKTDDGKIEMRQFLVGTSHRSSRIDLFNLQIPLLYNLRFGHKQNFTIEAGPIINFNTGASIMTKYTVGSQSYSVKTKGISQTPVTVDLYLSAGWGSIGLYARYAPMHVLRSRADFDFGTFSTGITVGF